MGSSDDSSVPVLAIFMFATSKPVVANSNPYPDLSWSIGQRTKFFMSSPHKVYPGNHILGDTVLHFVPSAGIILAIGSTKDFILVSHAGWDYLLTSMSLKIESVRRCPWRQCPWQQHEVTRKGLPCTAAFTCSNYKVQGRTLRLWVWS
jgi:hypothetical protein